MKSKVLGYCPGTGVSDPFTEMFPDGVMNLASRDADVSKCAAIVLWGGEDISPSLYDQKVGGAHALDKPSKRDIFEWEMMREAVANKIPIIGVCRGAQIATAFAGGSLVQHVTFHSAGDHEITTFDNIKFNTNSYHHQMMNPYDMDDKDYQLIGWSSTPQSKVYVGEDELDNDVKLKDGTLFRNMKEPEIVFYPKIRAFCVQGHPEWMHKDNAMNTYIKNALNNLFF